MTRGTLGAVALLALATCVPATLQGQDGKVDKMMDAAQTAHDKGRYQDALAKYQSAHQESGGAEVDAILGALEASLALGRYDGIITQVSGASSDDPAQQAQIDALVGRAHLFVAYVVDPTATSEQRAELAKQHRIRATSRLLKASGSEGDWAVRSQYYLAEAKAALGDGPGAQEAVEAFFSAGGSNMPEATSAATLRDCLSDDSWMPEGSPPAVAPSKTMGSNPRRATDGASVLAAIMSSDGKLTCMRLLPPQSARANEGVLNTMSTWTYSPARNEAGEAIAISYMVPVDFTAE